MSQAIQICFVFSAGYPDWLCFLAQAIQIGFDANYGLFTSTADSLAYPQPAASKIPNGLGLLEFLGLVVGKALYEGILLDVPLASFFVTRLQGRRPMFDELSALDPDLHRSLLHLKRCSFSVHSLLTCCVYTFLTYCCTQFPDLLCCLQFFGFLLYTKPRRCVQQQASQEVHISLTCCAHSFLTCCVHVFLTRCMHFLACSTGV